MLLLNEDEVRRLLTMDLALEAVEQGLRKMALDEAQNVPRARTQTDHAMQHILSASAKGVNALERGSQVHFMAEVQDLFDFPPAAGLGWDGKLDPKKFAADSPEVRGQNLFFGKAQCATCHPAPFYTDNLMHDLKVERFYKTQSINGLVATQQGPIKTFPLRGIKESPPYFHDGRLPTLEDTVEFFNLILETKLTAEEKKQLVAFIRQL